jgi:hypothetical protein
MDSVSVAYNSEVSNTENQNSYVNPYETTTDNSANIYCGKRTYVLGGAGSPLPNWLQFDDLTGTFSYGTADDALINYSPGHLVTLKACLEYYPTVCSTPITYTFVIIEC